MNRIALFCLAVSAVSLFGCGAAVQSEPAKKIEEVNHDSIHESNTDGTATLIHGELNSTKGAQGMLDGYLISREQLEQYFSNNEGNVLFGNSFTVKAITQVYKCPPMAQCLLGGRIPSLKHIQIVEPSYSGSACPKNIQEGNSCIDESNICVLDGGEYDQSQGEICGESTHLECNSKTWQIMTEANVCLLD